MERVVDGRVSVEDEVITVLGQPAPSTVDCQTPPVTKRAA